MRTNGFKIIRCLSGNFHVECMEISNMIRYKDFMENQSETEVLPVKTVKRIVILRAIITKDCPQFPAIKDMYNRRMAA